LVHKKAVAIASITFSFVRSMPSPSNTMLAIAVCNWGETATPLPRNARSVAENDQRIMFPV
jgi:hypothetical protein